MNVRTYEDLRKERFNEQNLITDTSEEQIAVEESVNKLYKIYFKSLELDSDIPKLIRETHASFLLSSLTHLPNLYQCLDASRPWLCYWILHSLELINQKLIPEDKSKIAQFLARCQSPEGGFAGGPGQYAHLAPTYAAVNALSTLGTEEAYQVIDREKLQKFLWSVKFPDGGFSLHVGGEKDMRGVYCAVSVATLTNIASDALFNKSAEWIIGCQTYEGGFAGYPGLEAHGGYAFCGIAALTLLKKEKLCNSQALLRWLVNRQMRFEGGFQGRTNKLVDGCYSFWQGGAFPIIHRMLYEENPEILSVDRWLLNHEALQEYILVCCQNPTGGFIERPKKPKDIYHTCYTLSGLSIAQHPAKGDPVIVGTERNLLNKVHPVYNISASSFLNAIQYFASLPVPS